MIEQLKKEAYLKAKETTRSRRWPRKESRQAPLVPPTEDSVFTQEFYRHKPEVKHYNPGTVIMGYKVLALVLKTDRGREFTELVPHREEINYLGAARMIGDEWCTVVTCFPASPYEILLNEVTKKLEERPDAVLCRVCLDGVTFCRESKFDGDYEFTGTVLAKRHHIDRMQKYFPCTCGLQFLNSLMKLSMHLQDAAYRWF
jgi:hypothetical protein